MRLEWPIGGIALAMVVSAQHAAAAPLRVGPGAAYATPCDAVAAAAPDDEIEIEAGTYTDSCTIAVAGLTLRGVGGQPKIDLSGTDHPAQYKGIYVVDAAGVTIENLELTGAHISVDNGANAAGIRVQAADLTVQGCNIHDNQNGILGGTTGAITVEHTEFFHNGLGDGCNEGGCTHNLYIADVDALHFRFNWSHAIATDTPDKGHLLKSRAKSNYIEYNRLSGEDGFDSYEIDLPNGGYASIVGNVIEKGSASGNSNLVIWGEEGASNPENDVLVINNTFVNDSGSGTFISADGATLTVKDNLFVGPGTVLGSGAVSADNLSGIDPLFVDRAHFDYHLMAGSPAIGKGVEALVANATTLNAQFEYVHPRGAVERASAHDVGAFEYRTDPSATSDAGTPSHDAGSGMAGTGSGGTSSGSGGTPSTGARRDAGMIVGANGDSGPSTDAGTGDDANDGCGCSVPGARRDAGPSTYLLCALLLLLRIRTTGRRGAWKTGLSNKINSSRLPAFLWFAVFAALRVLVGCSDSDAVGHADASRPNMTPTHTGTGGQASDAGKLRDAGAPTTTQDAAPPGSSNDGGGALCTELGWCELPDTKLESVCPDPAAYPEIQANEGCGGVINDWGGGAADQKRNRLLIWGGGHRGYFGNEVYVLDLTLLAMLRLNDPSDVSSVNVDDCTAPEAYADGRPSSRHTYDGLAYLADADKMFSVAGAGIPCGYGVTGTWTFDLASLDWKNMNPDPHPTKAAYGVVSDYDPNTKRIVLDDTYSLWSYDLASNTYTLLNDSNQTNAHIDYHMTGRVDPKRKLFVIVGGKSEDAGGMQVFDLAAGSAYAQQDWTDQVAGCDGLLAANSPGFAYDPVQERLVGWAGGDTIYVFDPDAKACTTVSFAGGPVAQNENGTFGRFRYFASLNVFAVVNDYRQNAFTLRLTR